MPASRHRPPTLAAIGLALLLGSATAFAPASHAADEDGKAARPAAKSPTFGGKQFWSDELVFHDWRIQRNVLTGHYRLLDEDDFRHAAGTFAACRARLDALKDERQLPPMRGKAVLLIHGLGRSRQSMAGMAQYLREQSDYLVLSVTYASTRRDMKLHAASLARVVRHLDDVHEINFVAHSMGNLVIRRYLGELDARGAERRAVPKRVVMLAPPNNGSALAERFRENALFKTFWGISGLEIADWERLQDKLAVPACFGIIAGGSGDENGRNPLIPGDDDFVVSVDETRLPGADDFLVVDTLHGIIMDHPQVRESTLRFLQEGHFLAADQRRPIPAP